VGAGVALRSAPQLWRKLLERSLMQRALAGELCIRDDVTISNKIVTMTSVMQKKLTAEINKYGNKIH